MSESIMQRVDRIAHDHNISRKEALRVALAESRLEARRAAASPESGEKR